MRLYSREIELESYFSGAFRSQVRPLQRAFLRTIMPKIRLIIVYSISPVGMTFGGPDIVAGTYGIIMNALSLLVPLTPALPISLDMLEAHCLFPLNQRFGPST